ncbi:MAG: hypothetical protein GF404_13700, partial [candidate division Zixibacteria bacterium]|nr:hypothetical protein [candidate division Zixibacteria bacterium]
MGRVYKRGKQWYIDTYSKSGIRIRKTVGTSKKLAQLILADIESKLARDEYKLNPKDIEFEELLEIYLDYSNTNHSEATHRRYWNVIRNFKVFMGLKHPQLKKVSQLDPMIFEKYKKFRKNTDLGRAEIPEHLAHLVKPNCVKAKTRTINYEIKTLRSIFKFGIDRGLCTLNPCTGVKSIKVTDSKSPRFLNRDECIRLLKACNQELRSIFYTFLNTGLRM